MDYTISRQPKREDGFTTIFTKGAVERFIWSQVKPPLVKLLEFIADKVPAPTKENTRWRNTDNFIDIRDEFFRLENNPDREKQFRAIFNFFIIMYDFDPYYQQRIDWMLEKIFQMKWESREEGRPCPPCWREFETNEK